MLKQLFFFTVLSLLTFTTFEGNAQEMSKNAIGLRLGSNNGFGAEISYQRAISSNNRLEFGLGWEDDRHFDAIKTIGIYQWVFPIEGNFNWYVGPGVGVGYIDFDDDHFHTRNDRHFHDDDSEVFGLITGDVGIEYHFDFPLLLSLDVRPEIGFGDYYDDFNVNIGLGVRYQF